MQQIRISISGNHQGVKHRQKKGTEKTSINILDKNFIEAMKNYYQSLWDKAKKV